MITTSNINCHFWEDHKKIDIMAPAWLSNALGSCLWNSQHSGQNDSCFFFLLFLKSKKKVSELEVTGSDCILF